MRVFSVLMRAIFVNAEKNKIKETTDHCFATTASSGDVTAITNPPPLLTRGRRDLRRAGLAPTRRRRARRAGSGPGSEIERRGGAAGGGCSGFPLSESGGGGARTLASQSPAGGDGGSGGRRVVGDEIPPRRVPPRVPEAGDLVRRELCVAEDGLEPALGIVVDVGHR